MNNNYLIPANSKKSQLILGFFTPIDLLIFGIGITLTITLIIIGGTSSSIVKLILVLAPALISGFLVMPVPNYHNVFTLFGNIYHFFTSRRKYYWKGWCQSYDKER